MRFPTTASPCSDWLPCQAEAVQARLQPWVDVLMHIHIVVGKSVNVKAVSWLVNMHTATDMTCAKGKFKPGEAYVDFSRVKSLDKLHIINYTQSQNHMSEHVEKEMKRLRKNILPQMPSYLFHDIPDGVKILHLNIGNLKRKIEDIKGDDIFKNSHMISLNQTHLGHSEALTPDVMGISKDVFIVHCDCNNRGSGVALIINKNLHPKQIRIHTILVHCCCKDK